MLIETIKQAAISAIENSKPTAIFLGKVIEVNPLKIEIEPKSILEQDELMLTKNVIDYSVDMTVDHSTENDDSLSTKHSHPNVEESSFDSHHEHKYKGKKSFYIHNALKVGDSVILIRVQGDQQYIVLDKVMEIDTQSE